MISLSMLQKIIILRVLSNLMGHNYWAQAIGLAPRSAKGAITKPIRMSSDPRTQARAMITRDLDVSRAYILLNRFNR